MAAGWLPTRWWIGALLAVVAVGGLFLASRAGGGDAYVGGLVLFAISTLGIFVTIASGTGAGLSGLLSRIEPLPPHGAVRWAASGAGAVIAVMGLFHARAAPAWTFGYGEGLALFALAVAYDFLLLKDWFDRRRAD